MAVPFVKLKVCSAKMKSRRVSGGVGGGARHTYPFSMHAHYCCMLVLPLHTVTMCLLAYSVIRQADGNDVQG